MDNEWQDINWCPAIHFEKSPQKVAAVEAIRAIGMLSSMGRNEIISDMFGRLHYMDRRGSGIGRILNSYAEFVQKPEFFSNEHYFLVVLPNRSVAELAQTSIDLMETQSDDTKTQPEARKTQFGIEKTQFVHEERDWEMYYFCEVFLKKHGADLRPKAYERLISLFDRYRYSYNFNRRNIADLFGITENAASRFLKACTERGIIHKNKVDEYCFLMD